MVEIEKLQSLQGMLDYPDPENPDKGTTEQQYQEFVRNHHNILSDLVATNLWQPDTRYEVGQIVTSPNMVANTVAKVIRAGTTSSGEPVWSGAGNTLADGTVTYSIVYRTIDYATQEEVTAGTNATKIITPAMLGKTIITDLASNARANINDTKKSVSAGVTGILPVSHGGTGKNSLADIIVGTASKLATAREINLTGDVNGTGTFDGTQALEIVTTLAKESGVVDGNVSNPNAWWVKLGGKIPLIIQGGITTGDKQIFSIYYPIAYKKILSISLVQLWDSRNEKFAPRIMSYNTNYFKGLWGAKWYNEEIADRRCFWVSLGM